MSIVIDKYTRLFEAPQINRFLAEVRVDITVRQQSPWPRWVHLPPYEITTKS